MTKFILSLFIFSYSFNALACIRANDILYISDIRLHQTIKTDNNITLISPDKLDIVATSAKVNKISNNKKEVIYKYDIMVKTPKEDERYVKSFVLITFPDGRELRFNIEREKTESQKKGLYTIQSGGCQ